MQPRNLQPYIIRARKRPLRVAYLLDAYQTKAADVDALLWTCLRSWGGRLSPILPFTDGSLPDAACDPAALKVIHPPL